MRVPQLVSDFFDWRWAPCVGLTAGSLAFVALALLFIPKRLGGEPQVISTLSSLDYPRPQRAILGASLTRSATQVEVPREEELRVARALPPPSPPSNEVSAPPQRGFSPILDRPEPLPAAPAPAPPPPALTAAEPPAPAPGTVVVIQPVPGGESREVTTQ